MLLAVSSYVLFELEAPLIWGGSATAPTDEAFVSSSATDAGAAALTAGFEGGSSRTGEGNGAGMLVPSVRDLKLKSKAGSSKRLGAGAPVAGAAALSVLAGMAADIWGFSRLR